MDAAREFWNSIENYQTIFNMFDSGAIDEVKAHIAPVSHQLTVCDFGCGHGHFLPWLSEKFQRVIAIDFAENCLRKAKERCPEPNISFICSDMRDPALRAESIDIAVSMLSILPETTKDTDSIIARIYQCLKSGGKFIGVLPAMDVVVYLAMLKVERLKREGVEESEALLKIGEEFKTYQFDPIAGYFFDNPGGTRQKYCYSFEINYRFRKAGFSNSSLTKLYYPWEYCRDHFYGYFPECEPIWDWLVTAEKS